ncbi:MAG: hypothetical protein H6Q90_1239 [Deltaproteobacteria bacterium]|nr:hypothetical protein [Deltaproteobacteria bacterium]
MTWSSENECATSCAAVAQISLTSLPQTSNTNTSVLGMKGLQVNGETPPMPLPIPSWAEVPPTMISKCLAVPGSTSVISTLNGPNTSRMQVITLDHTASPCENSDSVPPLAPTMLDASGTRVELVVPERLTRQPPGQRFMKIVRVSAWAATITPGAGSSQTRTSLRESIRGSGVPSSSIESPRPGT